MELILASRSPRRRELLTMLGLRFESVPALAEESAPAGLSPADTVAALALQKAREVAARRPDALVVGADTVVFSQGRILGKPKDADEARAMLRALSGREHTVYTGVAVVQGCAERAESEATGVFFRELSDAEIDAYVASGEPLDKAGAYGAQGLGALLVRRIEGDFFNVMGLPLCLLNELLRGFGVDILQVRES